MGGSRSSIWMMPRGRRSKCCLISAAMRSSAITPVPSVYTVMFIGSATPNAETTWIWHWSARPAAQAFVATWGAGGGGGRGARARVLAGEGAAARGAAPAIGVDDDLAARQAAVALRAAGDEAAGGVDQEARVVQPFFGQHGPDDFLDHRVYEALLHGGVGGRLVRVVLGREHHGVDAVGLAVHIAQRDLALGVRAQKGQAPVLAQLGLALDEAVRVVDRRGHQLGRFVAGVAEHQALVAGAGVQMVVAGMVHALGDVVALLVVGHEHGAALVVDAVVGVVIADAPDGVARHLYVVHMGVG